MTTTETRSIQIAGLLLFLVLTASMFIGIWADPHTTLDVKILWSSALFVNTVTAFALGFRIGYLRWPG